MANIMFCEGFDASFMGGCGMAWLGMAILFFIIVFTRKWIGEEMGIPFSILFAFVGGFGGYLIVVSIVASHKLALFAGLLGYVIGGFGMPLFGIGEGEGE